MAGKFFDGRAAAMLANVGDYVALESRAREDSARQSDVYVALTAYASEADRERVISAGFQAHVPKPIEPGALVSAVAEMYRGRTISSGAL